MIRSICICLLFAVTSLNTVSAAEITACIIDTNDKTNPVLYYFPVSATRLHCDHMKNEAPVSLSDLYRDNWRLIQVISPVKIDQKDQQSAYVPPVIYMERLQPPTKNEAQNKPAEKLNESQDDEPQPTSSLLNWFKRDSIQKSTDSTAE